MGEHEWRRSGVAMAAGVAASVVSVMAVMSLVAGGCGGGATKAVQPAKAADVDEKTAEADASSHVAEVYETLQHGSSDSVFTLLADPLYVFGPRASDAMATRADVLTALREVLDPKAKKKLALTSKKLAVVVSRGGRSAYATDTLEVNGHALAMTAVLTNADDVWLVEAVALAETPGASEVDSALKDSAVVPPGAEGPKLRAPDTKAVVTRWQAGLLDQEQWGADLMAHDDGVMIGPSAGELARGKKLKKVWKARVETKTREAVSGDIEAALTTDGELAWISAPVTRVAEDGDPLPLRAFAIYAKADDGWTLMALQESVAIGDAGAGAKFMAIVPPKAAEPPPVVNEDAKPVEEAPPPKQHSKKKRPKHKRHVSNDSQ